MIKRNEVIHGESRETTLYRERIEKNGFIEDRTMSTVSVGLPFGKMDIKLKQN